MEAKHEIRKIDKLGRIVIPIEFRKVLYMNTNDDLEIFVDVDTIVLKKRLDKCIICGETSDLKVYREKYICCYCRKKVIELSISE